MKLRIDNIGQLVTPAPSDRPVGGWAMSELEITAGTSLLVLDGVIQSVGGSEAADRVVDAQGGVVTPGLVDAHTHVPFLGLRGGDRRSNRGIRQLSRPNVFRRGPL